MADNEELDPPPPHDISNVFAATELLSHNHLIQLNVSVHVSKRK